MKQLDDSNTNCAVSGRGGQVFLVEMICTFLFVTEIGCLKYYMKSEEGFLQAFSVGLSLSGMILIAGPISGACLNPAIAVTQPLFQYLLV